MINTGEHKIALITNRGKTIIYKYVANKLSLKFHLCYVTFFILFFVVWNILSLYNCWKWHFSY